MKCILVVNRINDVLFVDCDVEFAHYLNQQGAKCYQQDGSAGDNVTPENEAFQSEICEVDTSLIMQLFSPLVLSNCGLIEHKNACSSVTCENGFIFVFRQVEELQFIAINGDGTETEEFLNRKLQIFYRLVGFLFGPVTDEIGHSRFEEKKERWNFLRRILDTWAKLYNDEQSFLVEALEKLQVNELVSKKCIELLEELMKESENVPEHATKHALLLVNSKLLALYSAQNASELQPADILYIILLVQDIFPPQEHLEDMLSHSYSQTCRQYDRRSLGLPSTARLVSSHTEEEFEEEFHSALTTPTTTSISDGFRTPADHSAEHYPVDDRHHDDTSGTSHGSSFFNSAGSPYPDVSPQGDVNDGFFTPKSGSKPSSGRHSANSESGCSRSSLSSQSNTGMSSSVRESLRGSTQAIRTTLDQDYWCQMIFLQTKACPFSPHHLHLKQVLPGITLITVVQAERDHAATSLCQMFVIIKDLLSGRKDKLSHQQGLHLYDVMNSLLHKVQSALKKTQGDASRKHGDVRRKKADVKQMSDVCKLWESERFKLNLINYLEDVVGAELPTRLETSLLDLHEKLKKLFSHLYLSPQTVNENLQKVILSMSEKVGQELTDYKNYLSVKAQRNIPMTSYINEFPGLVHFIYTDRQSHQLTAPSFNITWEDGKKDATEYLKEKVWLMYELVNRKLSEGYTSVLLRDGDYYFSHFLWFEDNNGNPLSVEKAFKPSSDLPLTGILTGPFYRQLIQQCFPNAVPDSVHCYELFMMHVGLVHPQHIAAHCRQLAKKLWKITGEVSAPISLL